MKRDDETIKVIGMRRKIAQNMAESKRIFRISPMSMKSI